MKELLQHYMKVNDLVLDNPANNITTTTRELLKTTNLSIELTLEQYEIRESIKAIKYEEEFEITFSNLTDADLANLEEMLRFDINMGVEPIGNGLNNVYIKVNLSNATPIYNLCKDALKLWDK